MKLDEWLDFFHRHAAQKIFHFQHFKLLTGLKTHSLRVALKRLAGRKIIQRIARGYYANPFNPPTLEEVSGEIYRPSYISLESALYRYGVLSQLPHTLTCVTTKLPRKFATPYGTIEYRQVKKQYFFGFEREGSYGLACPEKAFVDFLYLNKRKTTRGLVSDLDLKRLNRKKLRTYAFKLGVAKALQAL